MGFAVMHLNKSSSSSSGSLGNHIDRKYVPKNADELKQKLNRFYDPKTKKFSDIKPGKTLNQRIKSRIDEGYTAPRKIRSNAVKSINFILSGTHEDMIKIFKDPKRADTWLRMNFKFLADEFGGPENIVSFALHMDEKTPHIHASIVPITKDGRLSAREYINGRKRLQELQDIYADKMKPFGLDRGERESRSEHLTVKEFYKVAEQSKLYTKTALNLPPEEKNKAIRVLINEIEKNRLEAKKTPKFDKNYRQKLK